MRERLDEHSRMLESQLAGLECLVREKGELNFPASNAAISGSSIDPSQTNAPSSF